MRKWIPSILNISQFSSSKTPNPTFTEHMGSILLALYENIRLNSNFLNLLVTKATQGN